MNPGSIRYGERSNAVESPCMFCALNLYFMSLLQLILLVGPFLLCYLLDRHFGHRVSATNVQHGLFDVSFGPQPSRSDAQLCN